jgi:hypothetical protein
MAKVQTSEVDLKPAPDNLGLSGLKFSNHGARPLFPGSLSVVYLRRFLSIRL